MKVQQLSVSETLKYARHDFMNQLQLIKLNLELGHIEDAKKVIDSYTADARKLFDLTKLGLPNTCEWLQTVSWRYQALRTEIQCQITVPIDLKYDESIVELLEKYYMYMNNSINPIHEYELYINVHSNEQGFYVQLKIMGELKDMICEKLMDEHGLLITSSEIISPTEWQFSMKAR